MNLNQSCLRHGQVLFLVVSALIPCASRQYSSQAAAQDVQYWLSNNSKPEVLAGTTPLAPSDLAAAASVFDTSVVRASYDRQQNGTGVASQGKAVHVGYDSGFAIASSQRNDLDTYDVPFLMRLNGLGQLRHTQLDSHGSNPDVNQFQLTRARLAFSGHAFTSDFLYFVQLDGRSTSGDNIRLLDYFLTYDFGHHALGLNDRLLQFKTGRYKVPFTMARYLSAREFEFADRSMGSIFFDVNRSLACGLQGESTCRDMPWNWELGIFNGLVTGGAETGSSGALDNNFAYSGRLACYPIGEWGQGQLADFQYHETLAMRTGMAFANSTVDRSGSTEFEILRVADSGATLASLLPAQVNQYTVNLYAVDASFKWRGWSTTLEYYFRQIEDFDSPAVADLFDHGFWFQLGKFVVPQKLQLLTRWSRVVGDSGTLGAVDQSSDEIAGGLAWYFREQNAKLTFDCSHLDGAPINSRALDISPGDIGWLFRTQMQFAF